MRGCVRVLDRRRRSVSDRLLRSVRGIVKIEGVVEKRDEVE